MKKAKNGQNVKVHYEGKLNDGTVFDSSKQRSQTLDFKLGTDSMLPDFEENVLGMSVGDTKKFKITNAYGDVNPDAIIEVPKEVFPEGFDFIVGNTVQGTGKEGQAVHATIRSSGDSSVVLDHNHPLAGEDLNFEIELVEIE